MAEIRPNRKKSLVENPLKLSQPLGAALAFLGLAEAMPVFHGAKGCTSFGLVTFVKHFREPIPFQSTALDEITTILGGADNIEQAILTVRNKHGAAIVGLCSTSLSETRGEDLLAEIRGLRRKHPEQIDGHVVALSAPDFEGSFPDGWAKATTAIIEQLVPAGGHPGKRRQINVLPGSHLTAGDLDELRAIIEAFGLEAVFLPDISGSLDGHMPAAFRPVTWGGTSLADLSTLGDALLTLAIGEHMRPAAEALEAKTGVQSQVFDRLLGLEPVDRLMVILSQISGQKVPALFRRQRSQLVDAMLDGHFYFGGKRIAIAADPDMLWAYGSFLAEMGSLLGAAVTTTGAPILEQLPIPEVVIGDLGDLEAGAKGCDLVLGNYHARHAAEAEGIPLYRIGYPILDRLGVQHQLALGYRGSRDLIFALGNLFIANAHEAGPHDWALPESGHGVLPPQPVMERSHDQRAPAVSH